MVAGFLSVIVGSMRLNARWRSILSLFSNRSQYVRYWRCEEHALVIVGGCVTSVAALSVRRIRLCLRAAFAFDLDRMEEVEVDKVFGRAGRNVSSSDCAAAQLYTHPNSASKVIPCGCAPNFISSSSGGGGAGFHPNQPPTVHATFQ